VAQFGGTELGKLRLTGARLLLRPWRSDDAEAVYTALRDDADAARFTTVPTPYTLADATHYTTVLGNASRQDGTAISCAMEERASGRLVGSADLRLGSGEIGYIVYRHARGRRFAAEAARTLTAWGLSHGLSRVQLHCDVRNLASVHTALAAGFRFEGVSWHVSLPRSGAAGSNVLDLARFACLADDPDDPIAPSISRLPGGLDDGVVALRPLAPDDTDAVRECEDAVSVGWSFDPDPPSRRDVARRCARAGLDWLVGSAAELAIVDVASGRLAGRLTLRLAGPPQVGGIGYVVHPAFRGRGYTARGLRLLVPWAFREAGFVRLELGAKVGNIASQRAATAAGFAPDGVATTRLRNPDGTFSGEMRYALISPAFS
jgi:RimJ/RimL family protein N-acetyltransferase